MKNHQYFTPCYIVYYLCYIEYLNVLILVYKSIEYVLQLGL